MYILTATDHRMDFYSKTANEKLTLFYRTPTEDERFGYENGKVKRVKGKVVNQLGAVRRTYGLAIVTGLGEGCFGKLEGGKAVPISSDKDSEHYDPNWKKQLMKYASEVVAELGKAVFEEPVWAVPTEADEPEVDGPDDVGDPEDDDLDPEDAEGN